MSERPSHLTPEMLDAASRASLNWPAERLYAHTWTHPETGCDCPARAAARAGGLEAGSDPLFGTNDEVRVLEALRHVWVRRSGYESSYYVAIGKGLGRLVAEVFRVAALDARRGAAIVYLNCKHREDGI